MITMDIKQTQLIKLNIGCAGIHNLTMSKTPAKPVAKPRTAGWIGKFHEVSLRSAPETQSVGSRLGTLEKQKIANPKHTRIRKPRNHLNSLVFSPNRAAAAYKMEQTREYFMPLANLLPSAPITRGKKTKTKSNNLI
jgi:hypothetical protein